MCWPGRRLPSFLNYKKTYLYSRGDHPRQHSTDEVIVPPGGRHWLRNTWPCIVFSCTENSVCMGHVLALHSSAQ